MSSAAPKLERAGRALAARVDTVDERSLAADLDRQGWAILPGLLTVAECAEVVDLYDEESRFRSHVVMARHGFGKGEYKYFRYPLPDLVGELRQALYPRLAPIANRWNEALRIRGRFPDTLADFLSRCHAAGQQRPTPLVLRYGVGDYNRLHQDLYGAHVFPMQTTVLLSAPGRDFSGGELVLTERQARMQSRADVVPLGQGDGVVFAVHDRPIVSKRGFARVNMRHGVSRLRGGHRHALGIIFHDAK